MISLGSSILIFVGIILSIFIIRRNEPFNYKDRTIIDLIANIVGLLLSASLVILTIIEIIVWDWSIWWHYIIVAFWFWLASMLGFLKID